jgi:hypothetical protein
MTLKDKNGKEIKVGHELNVPLEVFSSGIVVLDEENNELALELRHESKKILLKSFNENVWDYFEVLE